LRSRHVDISTTLLRVMLRVAVRAQHLAFFDLAFDPGTAPTSPHGVRDRELFHIRIGMVKHDAGWVRFTAP
jgi:hypothetical protein